MRARDEEVGGMGRFFGINVPVQAEEREQKKEGRKEGESQRERELKEN